MIAFYHTTTLSPNTVALATTSNNHKAEWRNVNAKQTTKQGQTTRDHKPPLIAFTATHTCKDSSKPNNSKCINITMDAKTSVNIEASNSSAETTKLIVGEGICKTRKIPDELGKVETLSRTEILT